MVEKSCSDEAVNGTSENTPDIELSRFMSNQKLLSEIERIMNTQLVEDMDTDKIEEYLAILQDRAPVMEDYDPISEWERLKSENPTSFELKEETDTVEPKSIRKKTRLFHIAEVTVAAVFCLAISANAFGFDPLQELLDWADGIVSAFSNPSGVMELPAGDPSEYHSLEEALNANGADSSGCPNWVPKDYNLSNVDLVRLNPIDQYSARYEAERGELIIRVISSGSNNWTGTEEREDDGYVYISHDAEYYIVTNFDQTKAGWSKDKNSYVISGQISEAEIKNMIDSIL